MKKLIAMLLCAVMVLGMFAGCGSNNNASTDNNTGNAPAANGGTQADGTTATGTAPVDASEPAIFRVLYSTELTTLNYLITSNAYEQAVGANLIDTLVEYNNKGEMQAGLAIDWSHNDDTTEWTLTLRDNATWVDCNGNVVKNVTAQDFVNAMQYNLTPANGCSTLSVVNGFLVNAEEYYNYMDAKAMAETATVAEDGTVYTIDEAGVVTATAADGTVSATLTPVSFDEVGIKAVNDTTLVYTLCDPCAYFLSMLTYVTYMPAYGMEEFGDKFATSCDTMYYCGAFYLSAYEPQVKQVLTKNAANWDAEHVYLDEIQKTYNAEASTIGPEMVLRGEIDYTSLSADIVDAWRADPETANMVSMERASSDYSYFYCFNFNVYKLNDSFYRNEGETAYAIADQYEPWNWEIAVNNEAFRQSIRHAINRLSTMYVETGDVETAKAYMENTITPAGACADPDTGKEFTAQAALAAIMATDSYNADLAVQYKAQAMQELSGSVTFPVKVLVRYNPNTTNWAEQCAVLEQQLESVLGADYIDIIVEAGPSEGFLSAVRRSCDYMLLLCNWGADYADPETWTDPFYQAVDESKVGGYNRGMRYAYLACAITDNTASAEVVAKYFELVEAAKAIPSGDARYAAFAEAEAYLIDHALAVPYGTSVSGYVATRLNPFEGQYASFGVSNSRYKGQHLLNGFYSMADYAADAANN